MSFTLEAKTPNPFVHFDNRGLVLSNGGRCAAFTGAALVQWVAETLDIVAEEGRATRSQHERVVGGFQVTPSGPVVVFAGERGQVLSVELSKADFMLLRDALRETFPRRR